MITVSVDEFYKSKNANKNMEIMINKHKYCSHRRSSKMIKITFREFWSKRWEESSIQISLNEHNRHFVGKIFFLSRFKVKVIKSDFFSSR